MASPDTTSQLLLCFFFLFVLIDQFNICWCSPAATVMLPLKTRAIPSKFARRPAPKKPAGSNRLSFHHNVTLTVSLTVGTPPQPVTMVLDTGSELSWLHCKKYNPNLTFLFNPSGSSSYSAFPCSSPTCTTRTRDFTTPATCGPNKQCHATLSYADASSTEGTLAADTFRIGTSPLPGTVFGCMDSGSSTNIEEDSKTTGLLGMNRGSLSFVTQMGFQKFSYCISGRDSSGVLLFGEASFKWLGPLNYTPLVKMSTPLPYFNRVAYTVNLEGIKVSGKQLRISKSLLAPDHTGAGQTMVDSGTQFTFLLGPVYEALKKEFAAQVGRTNRVLKPLGEPDFTFQGAMDLCYLAPKTLRDLRPLPAVTLAFRGAEMTVSGKRLMYRVPGQDRGPDSVHCFTFGNSDLLGIESYLIGNHHQQNVWMEYDLAKSRVGFAAMRCDIASQRLGLGE